MIWREKLIAFAIHFLITLVLAGAAAALIFLVWFPDPFQEMLGGTKLFWLVVGCDLALGPLLSLVIYNSKKSRKELIFDYSIVGAVQLAALVYGVWVVSSSRPVYVAFVKDRIEVVTAAEIEDVDLKDVPAPFNRRPWFGPQQVGTRVSTDQETDALFAALGGKDVSVLPKHYVPYDSQVESIKARAKTVDELIAKHPQAAAVVEVALRNADTSREKVEWLPVKHKRGFWTALIDAQSGNPVGYFDYDPY